MINTDKTFNGKPVSYEILTNGYKIYLDSNLWIEQTGQYGKPVDDTKTYEENCIAQINDITTIVTPNNNYGVPNDTYNQIIDDYTNELMEGGVI